MHACRSRVGGVLAGGVNLGVQVCVHVEESHKHKQYIDNEGKEGELEERARVK